MANAGRHNDTVILNRMINEGKLIKINESDWRAISKIKLIFNQIVLNDQNRKTESGHRYVWHSA